MYFRIGIEDNYEGRSLGWALEHPGCFAYAPSSEQALASMPDAIFEYSQWIVQRNDGQSWLEPSEIELAIEDNWRVYTIDENYDVSDQGYEVNAWFQHDWKPLTELDIERGLKLFTWTRQDLFSVAQSLDAQTLAMKQPGERWDIAGILKHIAGAEWWYLDQLGLAFPREQLSAEPFARLETVRQRLNEVLPGLIGSTQVVGVRGEFWSPRKLLRRALWHERDHTWHIYKLLNAD